MDGDRGDLTDEALREEIELVGELVVAATASPWADGPVRRRLRPRRPRRLPHSLSVRARQATTTGSGAKPLNPTVE